MSNLVIINHRTAPTQDQLREAIYGKTEAGVKLLEWKADKTGKCGSCVFAQGFDNQFEIDKSIPDTCVRCTSRDKAFITDAENWQGRKFQEQLVRQGYFRIYRIEAQGRFDCQCWSEKC